MICSECPNPVHPERLAAQPASKTCSAKCAAKRKRSRRDQLSIEHNRRKRKARAARKKEIS